MHRRLLLKLKLLCPQVHRFSWFRQICGVAESQLQFKCGTPSTGAWHEKKTNTELIQHDNTHPERAILRELVRIAVYSQYQHIFATVLTRVPCIGEIIIEEDRSYRVQAVEHMRVDKEGRTMAGYHAFVDVVQIPEDFQLKPFKLRKRKKRAT